MMNCYGLRSDRGKLINPKAKEIGPYINYFARFKKYRRIIYRRFHPSIYTQI